MQTCKHCDIVFMRPSGRPIPADCCERCHEEIEALGGMQKETPLDGCFEGPSTSAPQYDPVTRPAHYQSDEGIECIDAIRAALGLEGFVAHCRGTAIKYAWRAGSKGDAAKCLRKGAWYLTRAAEELEQ